MAVRLSDVALSAGVSKATASNVFNAPHKVRPDLREYVLQAARKLGYDGPDPRARVLSGGKANAIAVVPPGEVSLRVLFHVPYGRDLLGGIAEACGEIGAGMYLVPGTVAQKRANIRKALVDGVILSDESDRALVVEGVPVVVVDGGIDRDVHRVGMDEMQAAELVVRHLRLLGHRRVALYTVLRSGQCPPVFHPPGPDRKLTASLPGDMVRLEAIVRMLTQAGINPDGVPIVESAGDSSDEQGFGGAQEGAALLLDRAPEVTAVIVLGDTQALALLAEAKARGIAIPRDLSVVAFDNPAEFARCDPPLTTIDQPVAEKGRVAVRLLTEGGPPRHVLLPAKLVLRGSTAPPRG